MKKLNSSASLFIIFAVTILSASLAQAQTSIPIRIKTAGEAASVMGIVISESGIKMKPDLSAKEISPGEFSVDVPLDSDETGPEFLASAYIATKNGKVAFGEMTPISTEAPSWTIPECQPPVMSMNLITANEGLLSSLVRIREQRIKVAQAKISETLNGKYLERLRSIELGLAGHIEPALGPDLPPLQLINRLNVILNAPKVRDSFKKASAPNSESSASN